MTRSEGWRSYGIDCSIVGIGDGTTGSDLGLTGRTFQGYGKGNKTQPIEEVENIWAKEAEIVR